MRAISSCVWKLTIAIYPTLPENNMQFHVNYALNGTIFNPSCTKPFGTHTLYQGRGVGQTSCYFKNRCLREYEILYGIRDIFERPRNVKVFYIVINWLP